MSEVYRASGAQSLNWMARGACRQADPELFFPASSVTGLAAHQAELARAVCAPCAVRAACLAYATETRPEGIWGGTTQAERRAAYRRPARRQFRPPFKYLVGAAVTGGPPAAERPVPPGRAAR
jgi:WhiB family transcriptional regulator, redox-sensing transcriptional regulator